MAGNEARWSKACVFALGIILIVIGCSSRDDGKKGATASTSGSSGGLGGSGGGGGDPPVETKLPLLPELVDVRATVNDDAVTVEVAPLDAALDYRIYPLPDDSAITVDGDGSVIITNAIYRCSGMRESLYMLPDQTGVNDNAAGGSTIVSGNVLGFTRSEADALLGYVYDAPGAGRLPVYVIGNSQKTDEADAACGRPLFNSTRQKTYTTDEATRNALLAAQGRDDGIAFYVPDGASASTKPVYEGQTGDAPPNGPHVLRWVDGPEAAMRSGGKPIFDILSANEAGTVPLMRVHVQPYCSRFHDELVAGMARFKAVRQEGDQPLPVVHWAGITEKTVLVVEALDQGCPYQGHLSPAHGDAFTDSSIDYPAYLTLDELRAASATGEVFVNGQGAAGNRPRAVARSFVHAIPAPPAGMDFFAGFGVNAATDPFVDQGPTAGQWEYTHFKSASFDFTSYASSRALFGPMLGEFWTAFSDVGADVNGKVRLTALQKANLGSGTFLHASMEVDMLSTDRRYPQLMISDREAPIQESLDQGTTLVVQPKSPAPSFLQVQICDHRTWDVNNQCPRLPTVPSDKAPAGRLPSELTGVDRPVRFDVYVSQERIYVMLDGQPYSCTNLPALGEDGMPYSLPSGPVTVTWGDVLYHSGVDIDDAFGGQNYRFHKDHMKDMTRRHFDNLGFASNVAAPAWDEQRFPCSGGT